MSDTGPSVPDASVERLGARRWPSVVWLVPVLAVLGAVWLLYQNITNRGPLITIALETASGLKAGESVVKYREVTVGRVEAIRFSPDLESVLADVRMDREVAPYLDESAKFWVVSPQVSAQGITGLETVITGTYIEGTWDTVPGTTRSVFVADRRPPPTPDGTPGLRIRLIAIDGGSLEIGSPILYKRFEVGQIESKELSADGTAVEFEAFIRAPNDRHITASTRFWNASGIDLQLGADGARLRIASLSSLLRGGVSFTTSAASGDEPPVESGRAFELFSSESEAAENLTVGDAADMITLQINFSGSVRGLRTGAAVEYRGIRIGRVLDVTAAVEPANGTFRTHTLVGVSPTLLGLDRTDRQGLLTFLDGAVRRGLRAKLAMGNLLTGALYVNLEDNPAAEPAPFDPASEVPELPAVASDIDELTGSVEGILKRVDALPIEALLANAVALLENVNRLAADDSTRAIPGKVLSAVEAVEILVSRPELARSVVEMEAIAKALRAIAEDPDLAAAPDRLDTVLTSLAAVIGEFERRDTAADLAATIAALRRFSESDEFARLPAKALGAITAAEALVARPELGQTAVEAQELLKSLRTLIDDPGLKAAPGKLDALLASLGRIAGELDRKNTAADLAATVAAIRRFAEAPEFARLPGQTDRALQALAAVLEQPSLQAMPEQINQTLADLRRTLDLPGLDTVPADLSRTLASVRARLDDPALAGAMTELAPLLAEARAAVKGVSVRSDEALKSLSAILDDPGTRAAPGEIAAALRAARVVLEDDGLKDAAGEAATTLAALRRILEDPKTRAAPGELTATLESARTLLRSLEEQKAAENLASALAAAERLLADPALARASGELAATLAALRAVLETDGARDLPPALVQALHSATALIDDFQRNGVPGAAAGALDGVASASRAVERSVKGLPALLARLRDVTVRADALLKSVSVGSEFNYETVTAIREIRDAARAITDLTDLIQRRPNAIILGK